VRLASERIDKDLYRQIYRITFRVKSGKDIEVITSSNASFDECSMGAVDVFVVSRHLGGRWHAAVPGHSFKPKPLHGKT